MIQRHGITGLQTYQEGGGPVGTTAQHDLDSFLDNLNQLQMSDPVKKQAGISLGIPVPYGKDEAVDQMVGDYGDTLTWTGAHPEGEPYSPYGYGLLEEIKGDLQHKLGEKEEGEIGFRKPRGIRGLLSELAGDILGNPSRSIRGLGSVARGAIARLTGRREDTGGYVPGVSESIYRAVTPDYYDADEEQIVDALRRIVRNEPGDIERIVRPDQEEDAWRMYLGLSQQHDTFKESAHRPTIGSDEDDRYQDFADPNRILDQLVWHVPEQLRDMEEYEAADAEERRRMGIKGVLKAMEFQEMGLPFKGPYGLEHSKGDPYRVLDVGSGGDVMGTYTLGRGEDEEGPYISYYDKWDLHPPDIMGLNVAELSPVGKEFDIYGRMYYDPETYEPRQRGTRLASTPTEMLAGLPSLIQEDSP